MTSETIYSGPAAVRVSEEIELMYDAFGDQADPPLLLIAGLGAQMIAWDEAFCRLLAREGFWVIRYDNRDVGHATRLDEAGVPPMEQFMAAFMQGSRPALDTPYTLHEMAGDAAGLLDALEIEAAHVVGMSLGGMVAQLLAIDFPEKVQTLTLIGTTTMDPALPPPTPEALQVLLRPAPDGFESYVEQAVAGSRIMHGPLLPCDEDRARRHATRAYERGLSPAGTARQFAALLVTEWKAELAALDVPTLVMHGGADPLLPLAHGEDLAATIPGAELRVLEEAGHALPPPIWEEVVAAIKDHASAAREHARAVG